MMQFEIMDVPAQVCQSYYEDASGKLSGAASKDDSHLGARTN